MNHFQIFLLCVDLVFQVIVFAFVTAFKMDREWTECAILSSLLFICVLWWQALFQITWKWHLVASMFDHVITLVGFITVSFWMATKFPKIGLEIRYRYKQLMAALSRFQGKDR